MSLHQRACINKVDRRRGVLTREGEGAWCSSASTLRRPAWTARSWVVASMDCAILGGPGGKPLGRRSFPNSAEGVDRAVRWAAGVSGTEVAETHVVAEATAAYHELAAHRLAAAGVGGVVGKPAPGG